ncbi:hypothetical protein D3272_24600 [Lichenibacterium ramalinae]|uniref:Lipoprotein n=1 Tax=Lichenibacterium ramalinae TaxID=2316527 RepID=A0A4Q2R582_9HYPH|nr:hypothetical protein D3272_24600 [Lichenibacterium ramalinae]
MGLSLCGCAATEKLLPTTGGGGSVFGNLLAFHTSDPGPVPVAGQREDPLECPTIEILDGTASYRTYAGAEQTNEAVRYQFSMGEVARDCTKSGKEILLKVGVEGRVLLGPAGAPGSFTVPVRIAVRHDGDGKAVATKFFQVPATIAPGADSTTFQVVSEPIAVPFVTSHSDEDYTILVGFDASGKPAPAAAGPDRKPRRRARAATPPQG